MYTRHLFYLCELNGGGPIIDEISRELSKLGAPAFTIDIGVERWNDINPWDSLIYIAVECARCSKKLVYSLRRLSFIIENETMKLLKDMRWIEIEGSIVIKIVYYDDIISMVRGIGIVARDNKLYLYIDVVSKNYVYGVASKIAGIAAKLLAHKIAEEALR